MTAVVEFHADPAGRAPRRPPEHPLSIARVSRTSEDYSGRDEDLEGWFSDENEFDDEFAMD